MIRRHFAQLVFCPPLTTDVALRKRQDKKADRLNRIKGHRRFSDDIKKVFGPISQELHERGNKLIESLPKWEFMIWVTDVRRRKQKG